MSTANNNISFKTDPISLAVALGLLNPRSFEDFEDEKTEMEEEEEPKD